MKREANFRQIVKTTRITDVPIPGEKIKTYGDARRDAILWADDKIKRLRKKLRIADDAASGEYAHCEHLQATIDQLTEELAAERKNLMSDILGQRREK